MSVYFLLSFMWLYQYYPKEWINRFILPQYNGRGGRPVHACETLADSIQTCNRFWYVGTACGSHWCLPKVCWNLCWQYKFKHYDVASVRVFCMLYRSTFQNFFTFTLLPGSSAHLQIPKCSEWHPSAHSPVVSILSHTRLQLCGTNFQFLSVILPLSVLSNLPWNIWCKSFSFENLFLQSHCPEIWVCVSVCACVCVHVACIDFENMYS